MGWLIDANAGEMYLLQHESRTANDRFHCFWTACHNRWKIFLLEKGI